MAIDDTILFADYTCSLPTPAPTLSSLPRPSRCRFRPWTHRNFSPTVTRLLACDFESLPTPAPTITGPTATPTVTCVDSDNGAVDPYGDNCTSAWYANYGSTCGNYDDSDFSACEMCCVCNPYCTDSSDAPLVYCDLDASSGAAGSWIWDTAADFGFDGPSGGDSIVASAAYMSSRRPATSRASGRTAPRRRSTWSAWARSSSRTTCTAQVWARSSSK